MAFEKQGACGSETEIFLRDLGRRLAETSFEPRASSFLKQRISIALQIGNAASVVGTLKESDRLEDIFLSLNLLFLACNFCLLCYTLFQSQP